MGYSDRPTLRALEGYLIQEVGQAFLLLAMNAGESLPGVHAETPDAGEVCQRVAEAGKTGRILPQICREAKGFLLPADIESVLPPLQVLAW